VVQRHVSTCAKMFTGIVEEMGSVVSLESRDDMTLWDGSKGSGTELTVENCPTMMEGAYLGCSICVSGVCLTATELDMEQKRFKVGLAIKLIWNVLVAFWLISSLATFAINPFETDQEPHAESCEREL